MGSWRRCLPHLALLHAAACTVPATQGGPSARSASGSGDGTATADERLPAFLSGDFSERVARARQLSDERPASLEFHDAPAFARVAEQTAERDGLVPTVVDTGAFQLAFGFALLAKASSPPYAKTQRENLLAFYDRGKHVVHARLDAVSEGGEAELELLIAHELGHALQAQHFVAPNFASLPGEDARLARLALFEGDAMLTMLAYQAQRGFMPLGRRLLMAAGQAGDIATFERASGLGDASEGMSALTRARLEFPYASGLNLVSELYRAGGFALVNRAFERAPASTEQVLHPERYLAGDEPVPVSVPSVPEGYRAVAQGSVGELLTRLALSACVETPVAIRAAEGWGGDAFQIVEKAGLAGLLWATTWDTLEDAREFERAIRELSKSCWAHAQLTARSVFSGPAWVVRQGKNVAVQRGIPPGDAKPLGARLLELPQPRPKARRPFGAVQLRPAPNPAPLAKARQVRGRVVAPQMGVSAAVPAGYVSELSEIVVLAAVPPGGGRIVLTLSGWMVNAESLERLYAEYADGVESELRVPLKLHGDDRRVLTPLGEARMRTWHIADQGLTFQLLVIPMCANTGSLLVALASENDDQERQQHQWLATLARLPERPGALCDVLNP
ncbi:MAG TPA: hypothetical protein VI197_08070 [Polyangiaceae bacterium]